jgi:hypothetical protein
MRPSSLRPFSLNSQVKEDEVGTACNTNGEKMNACRILAESQKERDHWEDQDVGWWTILKCKI